MSNTESKKDYMVRATAADAQIRAFAITSGNLVEEARKAHDTKALATAALGRLLSGTVMMGDMLKNEKDLITVRIEGDGPLGGLLATADNKGNVKGYVVNTDVVLPHNANDHLDVGGGVGKGTLTVIRDTGLKDPYVGTVGLYTGEIAEDLTYYFAESEQTPSSVGLGVLVDAEGKVMAAGGFIIQLMPGALEETIIKLEENLTKIKSVTDILRAGHTPEEMLKLILEGFDVEFTGEMPVRFYCNCDKDRVERALMLIGSKELDDMISDGKEVELCCQFCNKKYNFSVEDLKAVKIKAINSKAKRDELKN
ncbi:MAG: Hsp33 family molecular chaperone HslO [Butyrivibrio sp.]|nr:Hsp33 family molecular chaperone HslO [Butyrivibrio sp.]